MSLITPASSCKTAARNPLYLQVKHILLDRVISGEFKPGEKLPSENALAQQTGVSLGTLRHAVDTLVSDGVLVRREGVGTFVGTFQQSGYWNKFQPFESVNAHDRFDLRRLVRFERIPASEETANALGIRTGDETIRLVRHMIKVHDGIETIISIDEVFLPPALYPGFNEAKFLACFRPEDSLYKFYDREFGVVITHQKCIVSCERIEGTLAESLVAPEAMQGERLTEGLQFSQGAIFIAKSTPI